MNASKFDQLSKMLGRRDSRRGLVAGGLGLAGAALGSRSLAQEGTPVATPAVDEHDPHTSADHAGADPVFLFVQHFESGAWTPKEGEEGVYVLTLTGSLASTTFFSDRPERIFGIAPTQQFLDGLGFTPSNPPNAALVAHTEEGDQEILVIELFNPVYDPATQTLTYEAQILADYGEHGLAHLARQQEDLHLPETLGDGSLFIDACSSRSITCYDKASGITIGKAESKMCFNYITMRCEHCRTAQRVCGNAYPDRCKDAKGNLLCGNAP
jgi:hypothetical protein